MERFIIVVPGWNCEKWAKRCINSVLNQTYQNFLCVVVDDASTDNTWSILQRIDHQGKHRKFMYLKNEQNLGSCYSMWRGINALDLNPDDIIVFLDLDDQLRWDALEVIRRHYRRNPNHLMAYGNWINEQGSVWDISKSVYPKSVIKKRSFREVRYQGAPVRTFKYKLVKGLSEYDMKDNSGAWIRNCTDVAFMIPLLELSGEGRIGVMKEPVYIYNQGRPGNTNEVYGGIAGKTKVWDSISSKKKKPLFSE